MSIFFTSDTHYFHKNIIKYSNRPFKHVDEMNETLITNWNSVVSDKDIIYHLGDFGFAPESSLANVSRRLNGEKHIILGNHDDIQKLKQSGHWRSISYYKELRVPDPDTKTGRQSIVLCHYSFRVWNKSHHGAWNLYGHSHGTLYNDPNMLSMDVGVDPCNYIPISYEQVKALMAKKTYKPIDHHGEDE
jgi:calcineurin-like phosphoesterase family protein